MTESTKIPEDKLSQVEMFWGVKIPLRDGINLNATLYRSKEQTDPAPAVFTLTPYVGQTYHDHAVYFAAHGYPFLCVDTRGRGNSEGEFKPFINEAKDGYDIVEWLARQPYCNGKVAMWGGSYAGYDQWATAKEFPPSLATIIPVASPCLGVDFPMKGNMTSPYLMQWLTLVSGKTLQDKIFWNHELYWGARFRNWFEAGAPFNELDTVLGNPSPILQEWLAHPHRDAYWDSYNPTSAEYAKLSLPVLTITGIYDGDQPGALTHYREHLKHRADSARSPHYLVIGPWDHAGTRTPQAEFVGLKVGPASLVDIAKLHLEWYAWTMKKGPKPQFLQNNVAYYVMGADQWRYTDTLESITARHEPWFLSSDCNPTDIFHSGKLTTERPSKSRVDEYVYDPRDVKHALLESKVDPESRADQRMLHALNGKQLVYHSAPFEKDTEISGFFKLSAWLSINQPDTDFEVRIYEALIDGGSVLLTTDGIRARYRESLREEKLIDTQEPLRYDFDQFFFVSREIKKGHRLRLVIGPVNSVYAQKNYNSGGVVSRESMKDARVVTVRLYHDDAHPSALYIPLGQPA
jgi:uncharacterized protein